MLADGLMLLSYEQGLQHALARFAAAYHQVGMTFANTEILAVVSLESHFDMH